MITREDLSKEQLKTVIDYIWSGFLDGMDEIMDMLMCEEWDNMDIKETNKLLKDIIEKDF